MSFWALLPATARLKLFATFRIVVLVPFRKPCRGGLKHGSTLNSSSRCAKLLSSGSRKVFTFVVSIFLRNVSRCETREHQEPLGKRCLWCSELPSYGRGELLSSLCAEFLSSLPTLWELNFGTSDGLYLLWSEFCSSEPGSFVFL